MYLISILIFILYIVLIENYTLYKGVIWSKDFLQRIHIIEVTAAKLKKNLIYISWYC